MNKAEPKIIKIPITSKQRRINEMGEGYVRCEISNRWIQFPKESLSLKWIPINIMTLGNDEKPKKICELIIDGEDLIRAIESIKFKDE